jgi:hypothetical protein
LTLEEIHQTLFSKNFRKVLKPTVMKQRGKNNYGLGNTMINWPTGQNFFHNGWWHGNTSAYYQQRKM